MKSKLLQLRKVLLVAVGLLVGASAWAQDEYTEIYKRSLSDWTAEDVTDWNGNSNVVADADTMLTTNGLGANASATATYVAKTFTVGDNNKVKYEVDWTFATAAGRDNNWNWIQFGNFLRVAINSTYNLQVSTNAGETWNSTNLGYYYNTVITKHFEVIFDTQTKTIESFKYDGTDKTELVAGTYNDATFNTVSTGFVRGGSVNWGLANYIKAITVSEAKQAAAAEATYTINYTFGGSTIYTESGTSVEGVTIDAKAAISVDDVKYLCEVENAPSLVLVAGENTLNVPVRKPYTATLKVTTDIAGEQSTNTTTLTETDDKVCTWSYAYPYYIEKESVYYVADVITSFGETGTFTDGQIIEKTVTYTNSDKTVLYYGEPNQGASGTNFAYSNGNTGWITGGVGYASNDVIRLGELPVGVYRFSIRVTDNSRTRNVVIGNYTNGTDKFPEIIKEYNATTAGMFEEIVTLTKPTYVCISGKDQGGGKFNQSADVDYVLVQVESISATIGKTGYATFASPYALDLDKLPEGVTAYYASAANNESVTLTPATGQVEAGTGLILEGTVEESYDIPVATTYATPLDGNLLVGCTTETEVEAGANKYVLVSNNGTAEFRSLVDKGATIPAGKAYLQTETNGARLAIVFDGETTGINEAVVNGTQQATGIYNLNGQRVAQPTKGLYIVNGKKVIVK